MAAMNPPHHWEWHVLLDLPEACIRRSLGFQSTLTRRPQNPSSGLNSHSVGQKSTDPSRKDSTGCSVVVRPASFAFCALRAAMGRPER